MNQYRLWSINRLIYCFWFNLIYYYEKLKNDKLIVLTQSIKNILAATLELTQKPTPTHTLLQHMKKKIIINKTKTTTCIVTTSQTITWWQTKKNIVRDKNEQQQKVTIKSETTRKNNKSQRINKNNKRTYQQANVQRNDVWSHLHDKT